MDFINPSRNRDNFINNPPRGGGGDAGLCPIVSFSEVNSANTNFVINNEDIVVSNTALLGGFQAIYDSDEAYFLTGHKVWLELTLDSVTTEGDNIATFVGLGIGWQTIGEVVILPNSSGNFSIFLFTGGPPDILESGLTLSLPLTIQLQLDTTTGSLYYDRGTGPQLIGNIGDYLGIDADPRTVTLFGGSNLEPNTIVGKINAGTSAPVITPPVGYITLCEAEAPDTENIVPPAVGGFLSNPDIDEVRDGSTYTLTSLDGSIEQAQIYQSRYHYCSLAGDQLFVEFTIDSFSDPNTQFAALFTNGILGGFDGVIILPDDGLGNAAIVDSAQPTANLLWTGPTPTLPWSIQLRMDSDGAITVVHNATPADETTPISVQSFGGTFQDQPVLFQQIVTLPAVASASATFTVNNGQFATNIALPAGYTSWEGKDQYYGAYRSFPFFIGTEGNVRPSLETGLQESPFYLSSTLGHGVRLTKNDGDVPPPDVVPPEWTGSLGSAGLTVIMDYPNSLYELYCDEKTNETNADQIVRLGVNAVFDVQLEIAHSQNGNNDPADGVDTTPDAWLIGVFEGLGSRYSKAVLFNNVPFVVGDAVSVVLDNTNDSEGYFIYARFIVNLGGQRVVYDPIMCRPQTEGLTFTPISEIITSGNTPNGETVKYEFNGVDDDYRKPYPDNLDINTAIEGVPITGAAGYNREALLAPFTWRSETIVSATVDVTGKIFDVDATGAIAPIKAYAHCPLTIDMETDGYLLECQLSQLTADEGYFLELVSPNNDEYIKVYPWFNGIDYDLVLETYSVNGAPTTIRQTIKANYVPALNDRFAIFIGTNLPLAGPSPTEFAVGILNDGINPVSTAQSLGGTFYNTGFLNSEWLGQSFIPRMGHDAVPIGDTVQMTSRFKVGEISAPTKAWVTANKPAGLVVRDLEGGVV